MRDSVPVEPEGPLDDDVIVCRCEEITAGEIRKAIRKYHATTVTEVKRRVRAGMGALPGKNMRQAGQPDYCGRDRKEDE